jgi:sugar (pentulose or hexulose) kinase
MRDLVLAIDLGLSWCKAAYLDQEGNLVATGRAYTRSILPARNGMLERLWDAVAASVCAAQRQLPDSVAVRTVAIGVACRGEFGTCLDHQGQGFWPVWDNALPRASPYIAQAYAPEVWHGKDPFAFGYATRLAAILLYLKNERPHEWSKIYRIGALHDYLVYRLAGVWVTDPTSGPGQEEWPEEIIAMTGLPRDAFPHTLPPQQVIGGLIAGACDALELPEGTPVVVGLHDGAASSLGVRAIDVGDACLTLGTNFVLRAVTGKRLTSRSFSYSILPGRWAWVNNVPKASAQLDIVAESLRDELRAELSKDLGPDLCSVSELHHHLGAFAEEVTPGSNELVIERIMAGQEELLRERVQMAQAAGHPKGVVYRAMMEAIAEGVLDLVSRSRQDGATPQRFVATGGGVHHHAFMKILAAMLDAPIEVAEPEAGLIGAGIAAAVGSGWYSTLTEAMAAMTSPGSILYPDPMSAHHYRRLHPV